MPKKNNLADFSRNQRPKSVTELLTEEVSPRLARQRRLSSTARAVRQRVTDPATAERFEQQLLREAALMEEGGQPSATIEGFQNPLVIDYIYDQAVKNNPNLTKEDVRGVEKAFTKERKNILTRLQKRREEGIREHKSYMEGRKTLDRLNDELEVRAKEELSRGGDPNAVERTKNNLREQISRNRGELERAYRPASAPKRLSTDTPRRLRREERHRVDRMQQEDQLTGAQTTPRDFKFTPSLGD